MEFIFMGFSAPPAQIKLINAGKPRETGSKTVAYKSRKQPSAAAIINQAGLRAYKRLTP